MRKRRARAPGRRSGSGVRGEEVLSPAPADRPAPVTDRGAFAWALLLTLVLLALGHSLGHGFVWDDRPLIVENRTVKHPAEIGTLVTSSFWETRDRHDRFRTFFRPLVSVTYMLDYAIWRLRPFGFHLTNLLLHLACCGLVLRVARREGIAPFGALAAAAWFAVQPVHVESVAWISARTDLLCAMFLLAAFAVHRRGSRRGRPVLHVAGASLLLAAAFFSKEMAATFPALVFLHRVLTCDEAGRLRRAILEAAPYAGVLAICLLLRQTALDGSPTMTLDVDAAGYVATTAFVLGRYVVLLLLPLGLDAHYPHAPLEHLGNPSALVSLLLLGIVATAGVWLFHRSRRTVFWIAWVFVTLTPVTAFGAFGDVIMADRFVYIPSVGAALVFGAALAGLARTGSRNRRLAVLLTVAVVVVFTGMSRGRTLLWKDDVTLFERAVRTSPDSAMLRCNLGFALYERGEYARARSHLRHAIALEPSYGMAHNNLAACLEREGRWKEALFHYREAFRGSPDLFEARANAGSLMSRRGDPEGLEVLREVVRSHPGHPAMRYALAEALYRQGRVDRAISHLERAAKSDPDYPNVHYLFGKIRFEQGRYEESARAFRRFLQRWNAEDDYRRWARSLIDRAEQAVAAR